jgi:hypothetical protein
LLDYSLRARGPGHRVLGEGGPCSRRPTLSRQRRWRWRPDIHGCLLAALHNVARRTDGARELASRHGWFVFVHWRRDGRLARSLGARSVWLVGGRADRPQRARNISSNRASNHDGKPDAKWHPSAEQRGNAAHLSLSVTARLVIGRPERRSAPLVTQSALIALWAGPFSRFAMDLSRSLPGADSVLRPTSWRHSPRATQRRTRAALRAHP